MGYSLLQISEVLLKADKTMYRLGAIAYENMFSEDSEDFDFERDVIYVYKKAVEYADELYIGTTTLDELVERLANKLVIYNYGQLNPIYSNAVTSNSVIPSGSVLNDLNDVTITNLQNNQILRYDSSLEQWVNSGTNTAIRSTQSFTATLNQTVFVTSSPFTVGLIDVYLNGVRLNSSNYSTFGSYTITLYDGCLADDIIDVTILEPVLDVVDLSPYALKSTTITINGVTYDLSTNRTWIIDALPPQTGNSGKYLTTDGTIASWGTINLTGYVPYTGATANLNLGEFQITAGQVTFDQSPTGSAGVGVMRWNNTEGTLDLGLKGGNVTLQVGQEQVVRVVNKSGSALNEAAYQVVKITDAQGQRLAVDLAQGNNDANSTDTIGIVTETIAINQEGFITTSGLVNEINTTGSLQGETWVDGDVIYLSPFTAGAITNIKPTAPNHSVILGYVVYAHAIHGKIFVKCDNGYEIGELHDVYAPTPSNNDGIFWNTANQRYQNNSIAGVLGYTPIGTNIYSADGTLTGNRVLSYSVTPFGAAENKLTFRNTGALGGTNDDFIFKASYNTAPTLSIWNPNYGGILSLGGGSVSFAGGRLNFNTGLFDIVLFPSGVESLRAFANGNVGIGVNGIDAGYKFDVNGTARVSGEMLISGLTVGKGKFNDYRNTAFGYNALINNGSNGVLITAIGSNAGASLGIGNIPYYSENTFVGAEAGYYQTTGNNNTAIGSRALRENISSGDNTAVGHGALYSNQASQNIGIGGSALSGNTTGFSNTGIGFRVLLKNSTGSNNTAIGSYAGAYFGGNPLNNNTTSSNSLYLGYYTSASANGNTNEVVIGYNTTGLGSNTTTIGNSSTILTALYGSLISGGISVNASAQLQVDSTTKGFLPPRMTTTQRDAISSPTTGLVVYVTDGTEGLYERTSSAWRLINASGGGGSVDELQVALLSQVYG